MLTLSAPSTYTVTSYPESWQPKRGEFRQTVRQDLPDGRSLIVELRCIAGVTRPDVIQAGIYAMAETHEGWRWSLVQGVSPEHITVQMNPLRQLRA